MTIRPMKEHIRTNFDPNLSAMYPMIGEKNSGKNGTHPFTKLASARFKPRLLIKRTR